MAGKRFTDNIWDRWDFAGNIALTNGRMPRQYFWLSKGKRKYPLKSPEVNVDAEADVDNLGR